MNVSAIQRAGAKSVTARQNPCPESNRCARQIEIGDVFVPTGDVDPNNDFSIDVDVINHWGQVFNPETKIDGCKRTTNPCDHTCGLLSGACVEIHADPEWAPEQVEPGDCHCPGAFSAQTKRRSIAIPSPGSQGDLDVDIWLELPGSGETTGTITRTIRFVEGGAVGCRVDTDCSTGEECVGGTCQPISDEGKNGGEEPSDLIDQIEQVFGSLTIFVVVLIFLIIALEVT